MDALVIGQSPRCPCMSIDANSRVGAKIRPALVMHAQVPNAATRSLLALLPPAAQRKWFRASPNPDSNPQWRADRPRTRLSASAGHVVAHESPCVRTLPLCILAPSLVGLQDRTFCKSGTRHASIAICRSDVSHLIDLMSFSFVVAGQSCSAEGESGRSKHLTDCSTMTKKNQPFAMNSVMEFTGESKTHCQLASLSDSFVNGRHCH